MSHFVPEDFDIPAQLETQRIRLRMLAPADVDKDFEAVIASATELTKVWPDSGWPVGLTLADNLKDLQRHEREFLDREAFAYTVVSLDESRVEGCVYVNPAIKQGYDAAVYLWARESPWGQGDDADLFRVVREWISASWPFTNPAFPGRTIDWQEWNRLPDLVQ